MKRFCLFVLIDTKNISKKGKKSFLSANLTWLIQSLEILS